MRCRQGRVPALDLPLPELLGPLEAEMQEGRHPVDRETGLGIAEPGHGRDHRILADVQVGEARKAQDLGQDIPADPEHLLLEGHDRGAEVDEGPVFEF